MELSKVKKNLEYIHFRDLIFNELFIHIKIVQTLRYVTKQNFTFYSLLGILNLIIMQPVTNQSIEITN